MLLVSLNPTDRVMIVSEHPLRSSNTDPDNKQQSRQNTLDAFQVSIPVLQSAQASRDAEFTHLD